MRDLDPMMIPTNWSTLTGGRITLTLRTSGKLTVNDDVTLDYDDYDERFLVSDRLELTPCLRFIRREGIETGGKTAQVLEYRMADTQSPDEFVRVDQGSILMRSVGDDVRVETTKRVLFTPPFDAPSLAIQADTFGYFDAFERMVRAAVKTAAKKAA